MERAPIVCRSRGFTLTEVMIVSVLAGVVMLGLVTFYLSSQIMWTDSSTQAIAQRDATLLLEVIRDSTQLAATAAIANPSAFNHDLTFYDRSNNPLIRFFWSAADSTVHWGSPPNNLDRGRVVGTTVERFHASVDG